MIHDQIGAAYCRELLAHLAIIPDGMMADVGNVARSLVA
jgi:hypothetical protein